MVPGIAIAKKKQALYARRQMAAWLAICLGLSGPAAYSAPLSGSPTLLYDAPLILLKFSVPKDLGTVKETFLGQSKKTIIIIQDAHAIPDAQRSVQKLIEYSQKNYGINLVALEGASSDLDARFFKSYPDKETLKKVFSQYRERAELAGGTAAAIFSGSEAIYSGIEDWDLYQDGIRYFLESLDLQSSIDPKLSRLIAELQSAKARLYSPQLLSIDQSLRSFRLNDKDLLGVLETLSKTKPPDAGSELALMLEEFGRSKESNGAVDLEVKRVAAQVQRELDGRGLLDEKKEFNQKFQAYQTSQMEPPAFALYLKETAIRNRIRVQVSKRLSYLVGNQKRMRDIEGTKLFDDFEDYAQSVKVSLFRSEEEKKLDRRNRLLEVAERFKKLELSRKDWNEVKGLLGSLDAWTVIQDGVEGKEEILKLIQDMKPHRNFYENAEARDRFFIHKTQSLLEEHNRSSAVLVAGGFHAEGLTHLLKEKGISYALIMPSIQKIPEQTAYLAHMRGEVSWSDYLVVENGKVDPRGAFFRAARDRLIEPARVPGGGREINPSGMPAPKAAILKNWRDQIIRDLADSGRLAHARDYTRFIDEVGSGLSAQADGALDSGVIARWQTNVKRFTDGLRFLNDQDKMTEANIANLLMSSRSGAAEPVIYSVLAARSDLRVKSLPALAGPARSGAGGADGRRSELRSGWGGADRVHVEVLWQTPERDVPVLIDFVIDEDMVDQLLNLEISPADYVNAIMREMKEQDGLKKLRLLMPILERPIGGFDPIEISGAAFARDNPIGKIVPEKAAMEFLKIKAFEAILARIKKISAPGAVSDGGAYRLDYQEKFSKAELHEAFKASLLAGLSMENELGRLMREPASDNRKIRTFETFFNKNEHQFTLEAKKMAVEYIVNSYAGLDRDASAWQTRLRDVERDRREFLELQIQLFVLSQSADQKCDLIVQLLRKMNRLDPQEKSIQQLLAMHENLAREQQIRLESKTKSLARAKEIKSHAEIFREIESALTQKDVNYAGALLEVLSTRAMSLSEMNQLLTYVPQLADDYAEASALFNAFQHKYRDLAAAEIVGGVQTSNEQRAILQNLYSAYFEDRAERRREKISAELVDQDDRERMMDQMESTRRAIINSQLDAVKQGVQRRDGAAGMATRFLFDEELQRTVTAIEVKYGIRVEIPFEDDMMSFLERPRVMNSAMFEELYSRKEAARIIEVIKELDRWLSIYPRELLLMSPSFQKISVVKKSRPWYRFGHRVDEMEIRVGFESPWARQDLYHEMGHALQGSLDGFDSYLDPSRLTRLILQNRGFFAAHAPDALRLAEEGTIGLQNLRTASLLVFQGLFDHHKAKWNAGNATSGADSTDPETKRGSRRIPKDFEKEGVSPIPKLGEPSLQIEYIFQMLDADNPGGDLNRNHPGELVAEYAALYAMFPDSLRRYEPIAFEFFEAIMGSMHSQTEVQDLLVGQDGRRRSELRKTNVITAEIVAKYLGPGKALKPDGQLAESAMAGLVLTEIQRGGLEEFIAALKKTVQTLVEHSGKRGDAEVQTAVRVQSFVTDLLGILERAELTNKKLTLALQLLDTDNAATFRGLVDGLLSGGVLSILERVILSGPMGNTEAQQRRLRDAGVTVQPQRSLESARGAQFVDQTLLPVIVKSRAAAARNPRLVPVGIDPAGTEDTDWNPLLDAGESVLQVVIALLLAERIKSAGAYRPDAKGELLKEIFELVGRDSQLLKFEIVTGPDSQPRVVVEINRSVFTDLIQDYKTKAEAAKSA